MPTCSTSAWFHAKSCGAMLLEARTSLSRDAAENRSAYVSALGSEFRRTIFYNALKIFQEPFKTLRLVSSSLFSEVEKGMSIHVVIITPFDSAMSYALGNVNEGTQLFV